ncbi:hypothetical protein DFJ74DRAFT_695463 [Hyaloraphidium curvatum]|nr:hypothetical protein DFJ74DRAFT_695463 [Hyaloraphidium curvatum]
MERAARATGACFGLAWRATRSSVTGDLVFLRATSVYGGSRLWEAVLGTLGDFRSTGTRSVSRKELVAVQTSLENRSDGADVSRDSSLLGELGQTLWADGDLVAVYADPSTAAIRDPHGSQLVELLDSGALSDPPGAWRVASRHSLADTWRRLWPRTPSFGEDLRAAYPDGHVRFHALPGARRIPASDSDRTEILRRLRAILSDLPRPPAADLHISRSIMPRPLPPPPGPWWATVRWPHAAPSILFAHLAVTEIIPGSEGVDSILLAAAEGESEGSIIAPADLAWLAHPYDGGMDVIFPSSSQRRRVAERHMEWTSRHPTGL